MLPLWSVLSYILLFCQGYDASLLFALLLIGHSIPTNNISMLTIGNIIIPDPFPIVHHTKALLVSYAFNVDAKNPVISQNLIVVSLLKTNYDIMLDLVLYYYYVYFFIYPFLLGEHSIAAICAVVLRYDYATSSQTQSPHSALSSHSVPFYLTQYSLCGPPICRRKRSFNCLLQKRLIKRILVIHR